MNKNEYLQELRNGLNSFPREEQESAIAYYVEFFEEAGVDNEQAVIASLGDPKKLAETILSESKANLGDNISPTFTPPQTFNMSQSSNNNNGCQTALIIFLMILSFPMWIGFLAGAFGLFIGLIAVLFGITISFAAAAAAGIGCGIYSIFINPPTGIFLIGVGLVFLGLTIIIIFPLFKLFLSLLRTFCKWIGRLFKSIFGRTGGNV